MLIYIIAERNPLTSDYLRNNNSLNSLLDLRFKYKIPLLIFLTHCDNYCDEVKKTDKDWKKTCEENIKNNKNILLLYINQIGIKYKSDFMMEENDIMHIALIEPTIINKEEIKKESDEEIIKEFDEEMLKVYNNSNDIEKKMMIKIYCKGKTKGIDEGKTKGIEEVQNFVKNNIKALAQKELIEKIKENLPSQFHNALLELN